MNSPSDSQTNIENIAGAIVFPILFALISFGVAFIPLAGGVAAVGVGILIGTFAAWCNAPLWCKCTMSFGAFLGFCFAFLTGESVRGMLIVAICLLGICLVVGLLLRRRRDSNC